MAGPPSRSTFPSGSGDPSSRRLGVGSGGGARQLRAQSVVARAGLDAGTPPTASASAGAQVTPLDGGKPPERLRVGNVQHVRCGSTPNGGHEGNVCDSVPFFEEALSKAVRENPDCAPKQNEQGTVNYVLTVDFKRKSLHLFPGASGQWRGKQARLRATRSRPRISSKSFVTFPELAPRRAVAMCAVERLWLCAVVKSQNDFESGGTARCVWGGLSEPGSAVRSLARGQR